MTPRRAIVETEAMLEDLKRRLARVSRKAAASSDDAFMAWWGSTGQTLLTRITQRVIAQYGSDEGSDPTDANIAIALAKNPNDARDGAADSFVAGFNGEEDPDEFAYTDFDALTSAAYSAGQAAAPKRRSELRRKSVSTDLRAFEQELGNWANTARDLVYRARSIEDLLDRLGATDKVREMRDLEQALSQAMAIAQRAIVAIEQQASLLENAPGGANTQAA